MSNKKMMRKMRTSRNKKKCRCRSSVAATAAIWTIAFVVVGFCGRSSEGMTMMMTADSAEEPAESHPPPQQHHPQDVTTTTTATETILSENSTSTTQSDRTATATMTTHGDGENNNNNSNESSTTTTNSYKEEILSGRTLAREKKTNLVDETTPPPPPDWGSYYDPQNVFCGNFDCYKILGLDYESFGVNIPDTKTITKHYRSLSRVWHPDKNKAKDAKARFVKIARAYEVLTSPSVRKEYDAMRYDQELYFQKYGASVLWQYAPKSDTTIVIVVLLIVSNMIAWYIQKHRWQLVANRLIKAAVEDWTPSAGGSPESKQLREDALAVLDKQRKAAADAETIASATATATDTTNETASASSSNGATATAADHKKVKKPVKQSIKEKKRLENEALQPIIVEMVSRMTDFGAGFHQPTWRDLLIVKLIKLPFKMSQASFWYTRYYLRRLQTLPLNEDEQRVLTRRAVGSIAWDTATDEDRTKMIARELWMDTKFAAWAEEQELNKMSSGERKHYLQMKKKGLLDKED